MSLNYMANRPQTLDPAHSTLKSSCCFILSCSIGFPLIRWDILTVAGIEPRGDQIRSWTLWRYPVIITLSREMQAALG